MAEESNGLGANLAPGSQAITGYDFGNAKDLQAVADVLAKFVKERNLSVDVRGKQYLFVEGWQLVFAFFGLTVVAQEPIALNQPNEMLPNRLNPGTPGTKPAIIYQCHAIVKNSLQRVVGQGFAIAGNDEDKLKNYERFALFSYAQTRAISKAGRNMLSFIIKMAGFEGTPFEEMGDGMAAGDEASTYATVVPPPAAPAAPPAPAPVTTEPAAPAPTPPTAPAAPSAPAAPASEQAAPTMTADTTIDKDGLPWDARIHSNAAEKMSANGKWKRRKNISDEQWVKVRAEYGVGTSEAGSESEPEVEAEETAPPPPAAPAPAAPKPAAPTAPAAPVPTPPAGAPAPAPTPPPAPTAPAATPSSAPAPATLAERTPLNETIVNKMIKDIELKGQAGFNYVIGRLQVAYTMSQPLYDHMNAELTKLGYTMPALPDTIVG